MPEYLTITSFYPLSFRVHKFTPVPGVLSMELPTPLSIQPALVRVTDGSIYLLTADRGGSLTAIIPVLTRGNFTPLDKIPTEVYDVHVQRIKDNPELINGLRRLVNERWPLADYQPEPSYPSDQE